MISANKETPASEAPASVGAKVVRLRPPTRWHDPLNLIQNSAPSTSGRIVLWTISLLMLFLLGWAAFGQLDVIVVAEGRLTPQTLVKVVQPAEAGVLKELLVAEGDTVRKGQPLARLDLTVAQAERSGVSAELAIQALQIRRVEAELRGTPMLRLPSDDAARFEQVLYRFQANQQSLRDSLEGEKSLLLKARQEMRSAEEIERKLEQTLPNYARTAASYTKLEQEGFMSALAADEKRRELIEKEKDLAAQRALVASLAAMIGAQQKKVQGVKSSRDSELQRELSELRNRVQLLQPDLDKAIYREGLMELKAPQDGVIVDLATTTIGAVVKPGEVLLTLVPKHERLVATVGIRNEDVGFIRPGQAVQVKLAAFPFQKYGMARGTVTQVGADVSLSAASNAAAGGAAGERGAAAPPSSYKASVELASQTLESPGGELLRLTPGMVVTAEIQQSRRTILEYLLSPVQKAVHEAGRER